MHTSLATINSPEFINLTPLDINPLMSACEIKVLYIGENRNRSFISKEVATDMAKTLRGAPIVGYWRQDVEDFGDHGERVTLDVDGIKFDCLTKPYGFVSPDAKVWFQEFEDRNGFGEPIVREYLMTTGYLWTGQFEECKSAVEGEGKPHSMELDEGTLKGSWETNTKGMDFFIINDATFSKLCILGDDVEPCFEGSSVKAPDVSASFAKVDDNFRQTLFTMMQDLKFALEGGQQMEENKDVVVEEQAPVVEEPAAEPAVEPETPVDSETPAQEEPIAASENPEGEPAPEPEFKKDEDEDKDSEDKKDDEPAKDDEEDEEKKKYQALENQYADLQAQFDAITTEHATLTESYNTLKTSYDELVEFKRQIDDANKDRMIESFCMLSDEEKADVVANKAQYSLAEIEEKLSVICFRKGNFNSNNSSKNNNNTEAPITTFNFNGVTGDSKPAWLSAVDNNKNNKY